LRVTLSYQSQVVAGFVGNTAARSAFTLLGRELWEVPTVLYSNHPADRSFAGEAVPAKTLCDLVEGLRTNRLAARIDQILSGYFGSADQVEVVADALDGLREGGREVGYLCDPVIGDSEAGVYVREGIAEAIRDQLVPRATVVTPNHFELEFLTGRKVTDDASLWAAARTLQARGPDTVVVTSVATAKTPARTTRTAMVSHDQAWIVETPRFESPAHGAGDLLAALFSARLAMGMPPVEALSLAVSGVHGVVRATGDQPDLALTAARDEIVNPATNFPARPTPLPSSDDG